VAPLLDDKLAQLALAIDLRRNQDVPAALALERSGAGKRLMDGIRAEVLGVLHIEQDILVQREAEFQASMRILLAMIVASGLLALLFSLAFAFMLYRESRAAV